MNKHLDSLTGSCTWLSTRARKGASASAALLLCAGLAQSMTTGCEPSVDGTGTDHCDSGPPGKLSLNIVSPDGEVLDCAAPYHGSSIKLAFDAAVAKADPGAVELDACSPNADCANTIYKVKVSAPGLAFALPLGAFVHVQATLEDDGYGCSEHVMITNLPSWSGSPNPVQQGKQLFLAAADGDLGTLPGAPFTVGAVELVDCPTKTGDCGDTAKYDVRFTPTGDAGAAILVTTAETKAFALPDTPTAAAHDLRSYQGGGCEESEFGYWVAPTGAN